MNTLQTYLVGGAVRDALLGLPVKDRDWVVVGATPEAMTERGYRQVGADFPVFLHPETNEEYALARTERKQGKGYHGFECDAAPDVTLEEDLLRRDLTINAMAQDETGNLIDPFHGQRDLEAKQLRHVSPAFREDPLRILRVARFAARFHPLGFRIAPETETLMREMVNDDELSHLPAERIWQETQRALGEKTPHVYFEILRKTGALGTLMPELDALFGIPQPETYHPEIDCGVHALMSLEQAAYLSDDIGVRFASLVHDLGKALTPAAEWPKHFGHEKKGLKPIKALCKRLRTPKPCQALALLVCEYHTHIHRAGELRPDTFVRVLKACDAFRRPERFEHILLCSEADARGRTGFETRDYPQAERFRKALTTAKGVDVGALRNKGLEAKALGDAIDKERARLIRDALADEGHQT